MFFFFMLSMNQCTADKKILESQELNDNCTLDVNYIYNITKALSDVIFTEYDEENGELAKGRFFGTKGEWRAAEIIFNNMTEIGLYTTIEQIKNTPLHPKLTHLIQVLNYGLKVNNKTIKTSEFHIAPSNIGPRNNPNLLDYNFSYKGLKIIPMPKLLLPWALKYKLSNEKDDFVFITNEVQFLPNVQRSFAKTLWFKYLNPFRWIGVNHPFDQKKIQKALLYNFLPQWKGIIYYDLNNDTYNMGPIERSPFYITINGTLGKKILKNIDNTTIDFFINQTYNDSIISYNVIGQLNGTDPSKIVIVDCLYDSWWCQGTADAAIGMAMVLGVAKYFKDNNLTPKYNMKFIGFGGEEAGLRGAFYYEYAHRDEKIKYVIDLNQIGFRQKEPRLALEIIFNKLSFGTKIWKIAKQTDYVNKVGNTADIKPVWILMGAPSDDKVFALNRLITCKTVCFIKGYFWVLHHRDGQDHLKGDVLEYFDWDDVNATGDIVLNVTKYFTVKN